MGYLFARPGRRPIRLRHVRSRAIPSRTGDCRQKKRYTDLMSLSANREKTPREIAWDLAFTSRMNAIYYERLIAKLERRDFWLRIGAALLSSGGILVAVELAPHWVAIAVGMLAAVLTVFSQIFDDHGNIKRAAVMLPRYVRHLHRFETLYLEHNETLTLQILESALQDFHDTEALEAEKIRTADKKLLHEADRAARQELGALAA